MSPCVIDTASFPGIRIDGTEDSGQVVARTLACGPLGFLMLQGGSALVAATTCSFRFNASFFFLSFPRRQKDFFLELRSGCDKCPSALEEETISCRRPMSGRKPSLSLQSRRSCTRGRRQNQLCRGHGSPSVLRRRFVTP